MNHDSRNSSLPNQLEYSYFTIDLMKNQRRVVLAVSCLRVRACMSSDNRLEKFEKLHRSGKRKEMNWIRGAFVLFIDGGRDTKRAPNKKLQSIPNALSLPNWFFAIVLFGGPPGTWILQTSLVSAIKLYLLCWMWPNCSLQHVHVQWKYGKKTKRERE